MPELSSLDDLKRLREQIIAGEDETKPTIIVCAGTACQASESNRIIRAVKRYILLKDLVESTENISINLSNNAETSVLIGHVIESIRRTGEYSGDISEIIINTLI